MYDLFGDEESLNEHEVAWRSQNWSKVQELSEQFKEKEENVLFSILNSITVSKQDLSIEQAEQYNKYWIDNALSQHIDCIIPVYMMNMLGDSLDDLSHFRYYLHSISKGRRYGKWAKFTDNSEDKLVLKLISDFYHINMMDAKMYKEIMVKKGLLKSELSRLKTMATPEYIKQITKQKSEQTKLNKIIKAW